MYIAIVKEITKKGPKAGQVYYRLHLAPIAGGITWARSARYLSLPRIQRVAEWLFRHRLTWTEHQDPEDPIRYHAAVEWPDPVDLPMLDPRRICIGVGADYPHRHGSLSHCPDCAEEWPVEGREEGKVRSGDQAEAQGKVDYERAATAVEVPFSKREPGKAASEGGGTRNSSSQAPGGPGEPNAH